MCDYCSWVDQILARIRTEAKPVKKKRREYVDPVIVVHGGGGQIPRKMRDRMLLDVKEAAIKSYSDLINGGSAIDAVERAVCYMECKPFFNCGKGGALNANDEVVMDAAIMTTDDAGCVGAVRDIEHPISLARKVLEKTDHVLIVESGAQKFALDQGIPILQPGALNIRESITSDQIETSMYFTDECNWNNDDELENHVCDSDCVIKRSIQGESYPCCVQSDSIGDFFHEPMVLQVGAVGVVAYDRKKRLVSATSTAGESGKPIGSLSATGTVIGCGIYTDTNGGASVSGNDTSIYCYAPARRIIKNMCDGASIETAISTVLQDVVSETGETDIGAIAVNAKGEPYVSFNCEHFPWAYCQRGYIYYGSTEHEKYSEKVNVLERPLDCMCINSSDAE